MLKVNVGDAQKVIKMLRCFRTSRVNEPDKELPPEVFQAPFVVYTWDTDALDMPKVNRQNLGGYD
jgi:hypothetical protein